MYSVNWALVLGSRYMMGVNGIILPSMVLSQKWSVPLMPSGSVYLETSSPAILMNHCFLDSSPPPPSTYTGSAPVNSLSPITNIMM